MIGSYIVHMLCILMARVVDRGKFMLSTGALPHNEVVEPAASMHVEYPMLFRIENRKAIRHSHCGVLEFIAQEGMCYMPQWVRIQPLECHNVSSV
jgi:hypothetical protein